MDMACSIEWLKDTLCSVDITSEGARSLIRINVIADVPEGVCLSFCTVPVVRGEKTRVEVLPEGQGSGSCQKTCVAGAFRPRMQNP